MAVSLAWRVRVLKGFLGIIGVLLLFWWPLSHWFFSDWYHGLLGFAAGSYPEGMVKMIGTCGVFPVLLALIYPWRAGEQLSGLRLKSLGIFW